MTGTEKFCYYYIRDSKNKPLITVCLMNGEFGTSRGIALCSNSDNPTKVVGKDIAKRRALKAYWKSRSENPIKSKRAVQTYMLTDAQNLISHTNKEHPMKSEFGPVLNEYEKRIIKKG